MLRSNQHDFGHTTFYLSFGVRPGRSFNSDANEYFHSNRNNPDLRKAVEDQRGIFSGWNYGIGIQVDPNHPEGANRAYHMHLEVKLRDNVTTAELENAWSYANTAAMGGVSKSAYTVLSGRILPEDGALPSIENQPPVKPTINSDLVGKATTTTVIDVSTDPNTKVEIFDKMAIKLVQVQQILVDMHTLRQLVLYLKVMSLRKHIITAMNQKFQHLILNLQLTQFHLQHL